MRRSVRPASAVATLAVVAASISAGPFGNLATDQDVVVGDVAWQMRNTESGVNAGFGIVDATFVSNGQSDAFDTAGLVRLNGTRFDAGESLAAYFEGDPLFFPYDQAITNPVDYGDFGAQVNHVYFFDAPIARVEVRLFSFVNYPYTVVVDIEGNVGSDSGTVIVETSDGDAGLQASDGWVISDDNAADPLAGDPAILHAFFGGDASVLGGASINGLTRDTVFGSFGNQGFGSSIAVTMPAGGDANLYFFYEIAKDASALPLAGERYRSLQSLLDQGLLVALLAGDLELVANWGTPDCPADLNGDGIRDLADVIAFVDAFTAANCGGPAPLPRAPGDRIDADAPAAHQPFRTSADPRASR
jgi:hypothetical protein